MLPVLTSAQLKKLIWDLGNFLVLDINTFLKIWLKCTSTETKCIPGCVPVFVCGGLLPYSTNVLVGLK